MPGGQDRVARDPVPLDREFDVTLTGSGLEQIRPDGVVADQRCPERVLMVLGILREERHPGVAIERSPRFAVGRQQIAGAPHSPSSVTLQSFQQQSLADPITLPAAHHEHDVAGPHLGGQSLRGGLDRAGRHDRDPGASSGDRRCQLTGRCDRRVRDHDRPRCRRSPRRRPRPAHPRTRRAWPPSDGRSTARRRPTRADPARAGGWRPGSRGWPSDGGRSRHRPRRRPPRPCARDGGRCPRMSPDACRSRPARCQGPRQRPRPPAHSRRCGVRRSGAES